MQLRVRKRNVNIILSYSYGKVAHIVIVYTILNASFNITLDLESETAHG